MNFQIEDILSVLNKNKIRATYGAVASVLGVQPREVSKFLGERRPLASWVVSKQTGLPTGYDASQIHPDLQKQASVIDSATQLFRLLKENAGRATNHSQPIECKGNSLPYDVGNAGDIIKHGLLAEFVEWFCLTEGREICFLDPFGGMPWQDSPKPAVVKRIEMLNGSALARVQSEPSRRYYGSSHVVSRAATQTHQKASVFVSDRSAQARRELEASGLQAIDLSGFDPGDAYSLLNCNLNADLVLIDPFAEFLTDHADLVVPRLAQYSGRLAFALFVLHEDPRNAISRKFAELKRRFMPQRIELSCPPISGSEVRGESRYYSEVILVAPKLLQRPEVGQLITRLIEFGQRASKALGVGVDFKAHLANRANH